MIKAADKLMELDALVAQFVSDGDTVFVGGFGQGVPFALAREIIRQGKKDLHLVRTGADPLFDLLVAAGCVRKVTFGWYGNPGIGLSHVLRRAVSQGSLVIEETSNFGLLLSLHAAAMGLPFIPARILALGDVGQHTRSTPIACPFTGAPLHAVPAIVPDVAILHAHRASAEGLVQLTGVTGDTFEGARASLRVICTVEEIVDRQTCLANPEHSILPPALIGGIARAAYGAHPSYMAGCYDRDDAAYRRFDTLSREPEALERHLAETVWLEDGHAGYLARHHTDLAALTERATS
jgi:glutaconate CoA-transferase, subunit A